MKYSSRFFLYAPMGVFLLLFAAACLHWWFAASRLSERLEAWNGHEIVPGVTISYASHRTTGFPFSLDTEFRDVTLAVATPDGVTRWRTAEFAMHALAYGRDKTVFEAAGPQALSWTRDGGVRTMPIAVGSLHASAVVEKGALARFDFDLNGFGSNAFTARRLQFHLRRSGADKLDLFVAADDLRPAPGSCPGLGDRLGHAGLTASIAEAHALSGLLSGGEDWNAAFAAWRKTGGGVATDKTVPPLSALLDARAEDLIAVTGLAAALCGR
jgi:hypothetical protein